MKPVAATRLDALLEGIVAAPPLAIAGLTLDSRRVRKGDAFIALKGGSRHGLEHESEAVAAGASAILWDPGEGREPAAARHGVARVAVPGLRSRLGEIADRYYGAPSSRLAVAGVTGTNGKTTCAWLLAGAAGGALRRGAYLGTLGSGFPPDLESAALTTPDVVTLHRQLRALSDAGATHVAMEVSSHALDQGRIDGVRLRVAAFCNLSRDHLDYHVSIERYAFAKQRLFRVPGLEHAVINTGDPVGARFAAALASGVTLTAVAVGGERPAAERFIHVTRVDAANGGLKLEIDGHFGRRRLQSRLVGEFNAENLAITLGMLMAWDVGVDEALAALAMGTAPPGRMEGFRLPNGALAIVDYAHTPDALAKALKSLRAHAAGRVLVVFGCGGDRDTGKRALMGAAAEQLADRVIVTDDNPRSEDPDRIVGMILSGLRTPARALVQRDRALAIRAALAEAGPRDVVLVAGKGHEDYQLVGAERRQWSDREFLRAQAGGRGMNGRLSEVAAVTAGRLAGADGAFDGESIDSRTLKRGQLFFALRGERFDGHAFVAAVAGQGAAGAVVERALDAPLAQVVVKDSVVALAALARDWRGRSAATVIGVGGSNGKTTTKELLASILAGAGPTLATRGNLNNHLGVPLTLLRLEPGHRFAVIEMGANHPGEIAALAAIAKPAIALVTNAGDEHLEGFGDLAGVAKAEGEMFAALGDEGIAVINADDPFHGLWQQMARGARQVAFAIDAPADVRATDIKGRIESGAFVTVFTLAVSGEQARVRLRLAGRHNVMNALGAAAAAHAAGVALPAIVAGLDRVNPVNGRLQLKAGPRGSWLIDDSYNANPSSVRAGIDVLCSLPGEHWLVLGEMGELGPHTEASHTGVGDYARRAGITRLFAIGAAARLSVSAFGARGNFFEDAGQLADAVAAGLDAGVTVLIKGSRVNRLERVVERLAQPLAAAGNGN